jgi:ribosomal protein S7
VEGLVIGLVVFRLYRLREQRMTRRMREIGFLNHHIRNAMQTIELAAREIGDTQQRVAVDLSVRRVVETLSRINRESDELENGLQYAG